MHSRVWRVFSYLFNAGFFFSRYNKRFYKNSFFIRTTSLFVARCECRYRNLALMFKRLRSNEISHLVSMYDGYSRFSQYVFDMAEFYRLERIRFFKQGFIHVRFLLRFVYRQLSLGGDADIDILDHNDPYYGGVAFYVRPPLKAWKCVTDLSGGERTISSLALVLALHRYRQSPLYVFDEVDAALDCRNVTVLARYVLQNRK